MDPANADEALREVALDIEEGADIVMVKPALALPGPHLAREREFRCPVAAYNVSGEYAMLKAAAAKRLARRKTQPSSKCSPASRRAGADIILTYHAKDLARWLR